MDIFKIKSVDINHIISKLIDDGYDVYAPKKNREKYEFQTISKEEKIDIDDYTIAMYSTKFVFLPAFESLLRFKQSDFSSEPVSFNNKVAVFGMRPCDTISTLLLDKVFSEDPVDERYINRRKNSFTIQLDCNEMCSKYAYCYNMESYLSETGFDISLTKTEGDYLVRYGSDKGRKLISDLNLEQVVTEEFINAKEKIINYFNSKKEYEWKDVSNALETSFESEIWKQEAEKCLSCGSCNFVCPTCYCFNVRDKMEFDFDNGERSREWDGCMLRNFAIVAGKENFRKEKYQRLRHRIYRKGLYPIEKYERPFCVGCGRCVSNCLVRINPDKIFKRALEETNG